MSMLSWGSLSKLMMYLYRRVGGVPTPEMALLQRCCETPTGHSPQAQLQGIEGGCRLPRTFEEWFVPRKPVSASR